MVVRFQVDPDFYDHPKSLGLSDAATALWVRAGSYSAAKLTDGFIAEHVLATLTSTPEDAADELRRRGLWHKVRGGYRYHQWERRNLTKTRVEDDMKADRERKKRKRLETRSGTASGQRGAIEDGSSSNEAATNDDRRPVEQPRSFGRDNDEAETNGRRTDAAPQVRGQNVRPESERNPDGIQTDSERIPASSVSVSVSESVSGSGRPPDARSEPPPAKCPAHLEDPYPPPCGQCAESRKNRDAWDAERVRRVTNAPRCRIHRGQLAANCAPCRSEKLAAPEE